MVPADLAASMADVDQQTSRLWLDGGQLHSDGVGGGALI